MRQYCMPVFLAALLSLCIGATAAADIPRMINYQGTLLDNNNDPITQNGLGIDFKIWTDSTAGVVVWQESIVRDIVDGVLIHNIGSVNPLPDTVFTKFGQQWLEVVVDGQPIEPRSRIVSSPYSFRVSTLDSSSGGTVTGDIKLLSTAAGNALEVSNTGDGRAGYFQIANPANTEAALIATTSGSGLAALFFTEVGGTVLGVKGGDVSVSDGLGNSSILMQPDGSQDAGEIILYADNGFSRMATLKAVESAGAGSELSLYRDDGLRMVEIQSDENSTAQMNLYFDRGGAIPVRTVEISNTNAGLGGRMYLFDNTGSDTTIRIYAQVSPDSRGRIGVNAEPDSGTITVVSNQRYAGYFETDYASSYPVAVKGIFTGGNVGDPIGVWGESWPSDGKGSGGFFRGGEHGVRAIAEGGTASYNCSAIQGFAYGDQGGGDRFGIYAVGQGGSVAYGVYGYASQGDTNWSGYFAGNTYVSKLAVGTKDIPPNYHVAVDGKVLCEEVEVLLSDDWPDYVFEDDYALMSLEDLETNIEENGHLPDVPSASEVAQKGVSVGAMQGKLLKKVEELTLHVIALNKSLESVKREKEQLEQRLARLEGEGR
jgi:hypothetical protein